MVRLARRRHPGGAAAVVLPGLGAAIRRATLDQDCAIYAGRACHPRSCSGLRLLGVESVCLRSDDYVRTRQDGIALCARVRGEPPVAGGGGRHQGRHGSRDIVGVFAGDQDSLGLRCCSKLP